MNELKIVDFQTYLKEIGLEELMTEARAINNVANEVGYEKWRKVYPDTTIGIDAYFLSQERRAEKECAVCANCKGYPCAKETNIGFRYQVLVEYERLAIRWYECKFCKQHRLATALMKKFKSAEVPVRYSNKTFEDYKIDEGNEGAAKWARHIIDNPVNLFLYGEPGTGKTFLAALIAQEYIKQGRTVLFIDVPKLLNQLRASFAKGAEDTIESKMELLEKVDVLILDDIGTENLTEWAVERLYLVINERYNNERQTLITSNYTLNELAGRMNLGKDGKTGDRIASRLRQMCKVASLKGSDRRLIRR